MFELPLGTFSLFKSPARSPSGLTESESEDNGQQLKHSPIALWKRSLQVACSVIMSSELKQVFLKLGSDVLDVSNVSLVETSSGSCFFNFKYFLTCTRFQKTKVFIYVREKPKSLDFV